MTSSFNHAGGSATYSLKAGVTYNGTYYDAGMQLSVVAEGGAVKSRIAFKADQFYIMHPSNGTLSSAFIVDGGQVYIDTARIKDATINFAQITDTLQSNNYDGSTRGWRLGKDGTFINLGTGSGGGMKQTNTQISVRDGNGVLRVQIGEITGSW